MFTGSGGVTWERSIIIIRKNDQRRSNQTNHRKTMPQTPLPINLPTFKESSKFFLNKKQNPYLQANKDSANLQIN